MHQSGPSLNACGKHRPAELGVRLETPLLSLTCGVSMAYGGRLGQDAGVTWSGVQFDCSILIKVQ